MSDTATIAATMKIAREINEGRTSLVATAVKHHQKIQKLAGEIEKEREAYEAAYRAALTAWSKADLEAMNVVAPDQLGKIKPVPAAKPTAVAAPKKAAAK